MLMHIKKRLIFILAAIFVPVALVLVMHGLTVYMAISTWTGSFAVNAYHAGRQYQNLEAREQLMDKLGWLVKVRYVQNKLVITAQDRLGKPIVFNKLDVFLRHMVLDKHDKHISLQKVQDGIYEAYVPDLPYGSWDVFATLHKEGQIYQFADTLVR